MPKLNNTILLLILCGVSPACLRSRPTPDVWACKTEGDCAAGEVCLPDALGTGTSFCRPQGYCEVPADCPDTAQTCSGHQCYHLECTPYDAEACFPFGCDVNVCLTSCTLGGIACAEGYTCQDEACVAVECNPYDPAPGCGAYACRSNGVCEDDCLTQPCARGHICEAGSCSPDPALGCIVDHTCPVGICCPTASPEFSTCQNQAGCDYLPVGAACAWDAICASNNCQDGECRQCASEDCMQVCGDRACGAVQGIFCGECQEKYACDASGQCAFACDGYECGYSAAAYCGDCGAGEYCSVEGQCLADPCLGHDCGVIEDRFCGDCTNSLVCNEENLCELPCLGRSCGVHLGVNCGYCSGVCSTDGQCVLP